MERPILFSTDMVRAILEGRKSQTRRVLKIKESNNLDSERIKKLKFTHLSSEDFAWFSDTGVNVLIKNPYAKTTSLWVKETFYQMPFGYEIGYKANLFSEDSLKNTGFKPSLFMPKKYSRITLNVKSVRVERLNEISESDAVREGVEIMKTPSGLPNGFRDYIDKSLTNPTAKVSYETLWEKINGTNSWALNPFVWVIDFEVSSLMS